MAGGYTIEIAGDANKLIASTKDAGKALDTIADSLEELATDTTTSANKSAKSLTKIGKTGKEAAHDIDKAFDKAADSSEKSLTEARRASEKLASAIRSDADDIKHSQKNAAQATENAWAEVGDEMRQNWGETMSNFDGSAQSAIDMIADTFGGLAASFGIGGPVGSLLLGVMAGLISNWGSKWVESFGDVEKKNQEMYEQMLENANAYFNDEQIVKNFNDIMSGAEGALIDKDTLDTFVDHMNMSAQDIALAFADAHSKQAQALTDAVNKAQSDYDAAVKKINEEYAYANANDHATALGQAYKNFGVDQINQWRDFTKQVDATSQAIQKNSDYLQANGYGLADAGEAARDYAQAQAQAGEALKNTVEEITANNEAHGSAAAAIEANKSTLADYVETLQAEQEAAAAAGAGNEELTALQYAQAAAFLNAAEAAGIGADQAAELANEYGLITDAVKTDVSMLGADKAAKKAQDLQTKYKALPTSHKLSISTSYSAGQIEATLSSVQRQINNHSLSIPVHIDQSRLSIK
ncbi:MAG: hypothetical protein PT944_06460 [Actinomycetaceae bacterium]|nr:hypothetical protein [Actinomycetaceae bacterium]MDY5273011.1 hypothetical protein [Arcanobacterium sp.]